MNHGLGAKHATNLLLLRSLGRLFRTENLFLHCQHGIRALSLMFFEWKFVVLNVIEAFFRILCMMELFFACRLSL